MYQEQRTVFYYCISPVHMGADTTVGAIDNPVQREVHTGHPCFNGSGIKGAVRHRFTGAWTEDDLYGVFGPDPESTNSEFAGAVSFTDAQLAAFPVRTLKQTFAYATCPTALARLQRTAGSGAAWAVPNVEGDMFLGRAGDRLTIDNKLVLEAFEFDRMPGNALIDRIADWIAANALPAGPEYDYFRNKLSQDLVVLSDARFLHFAQYSTIVEPHVRIDNKSGTADDGGLFYTENVPPESLLVGRVLAKAECRGADGKGTPPRAAAAILNLLLSGPENNEGIEGKTVQLGGDATTGRGFVTIQTQPYTEGR
jgi:CRISPR-associated protein Cmr4